MKGDILKLHLRIFIFVMILAVAVSFSPITAKQSFAATKKPAKVKGLTLKKSKAANDGSCKVTVKWKKVKKNVKKYQVRIKNNKTKKVTVKKVSKEKNTASFTGKPGTTYVVKVRALGPKNTKGKWSAAKKITIPTVKKPAPTPLTTYWSSDSPVAKQLRNYVSKVTNAKDPDNYIPVKDRIAVFDMDGTLTCETFYTYYDTMMFIEFCLKDHPERVSDELKEVAGAIKPGYLADEALARNFAKAYAGMTVQELFDYASEFGEKKTASFVNMRYKDCFYLPMVELVKYLYDNDFTVYVVSGTERTTSRAIVANSPISKYVTPNHVIGTEFEVKVKGHETESSNMNYKYVDGDELVFSGGFIQKNLNANKTLFIEKEIGQRPVLAFGNTNSDTSMMNYTIDKRNPYPAEAYMVVADDTVREWGKQDWATMSAEYEAQGFVPVSMKNDFLQIYPEGIVPAETQYQEIDLTSMASDASFTDLLSRKAA